MPTVSDDIDVAPTPKVKRKPTSKSFSTSFSSSPMNTVINKSMTTPKTPRASSVARFCEDIQRKKSQFLDIRPFKKIKVELTLEKSKNKSIQDFTYTPRRLEYPTLSNVTRKDNFGRSCLVQQCKKKNYAQETEMMHNAEEKEAEIDETFPSCEEEFYKTDDNNRGLDYKSPFLSTDNSPSLNRNSNYYRSDPPFQIHDSPSHKNTHRFNFPPKRNQTTFLSANTTNKANLNGYLSNGISVQSLCGIDAPLSDASGFRQFVQNPMQKAQNPELPVKNETKSLVPSTDKREIRRWQASDVAPIYDVPTFNSDSEESDDLPSVFNLENDQRNVNKGGTQSDTFHYRQTKETEGTSLKKSWSRFGSATYESELNNHSESCHPSKGIRISKKSTAHARHSKPDELLDQRSIRITSPMSKQSISSVLNNNFDETTPMKRNNFNFSNVGNYSKSFLQRSNYLASSSSESYMRIVKPPFTNRCEDEMVPESNDQTVDRNLDDIKSNNSTEYNESSEERSPTSQSFWKYSGGNRQTLKESSYRLSSNNISMSSVSSNFKRKFFVSCQKSAETNQLDPSLTKDFDSEDGAHLNRCSKLSKFKSDSQKSASESPKPVAPLPKYDTLLRSLQQSYSRFQDGTSSSSPVSNQTTTCTDSSNQPGILRSNFSLQHDAAIVSPLVTRKEERTPDQVYIENKSKKAYPFEKDFSRRDTDLENESSNQVLCDEQKFTGKFHCFGKVLTPVPQDLHNRDKKEGLQYSQEDDLLLDDQIETNASSDTHNDDALVPGIVSLQNKVKTNDAIVPPWQQSIFTELDENEDYGFGSINVRRIYSDERDVIPEKASFNFFVDI